MKLKKKFKLILDIILIILFIILAIMIIRNIFPKTNTNEQVKVIEKIDDYGYTLKDNKSKKYKKLFKDLMKILNVEKPDEKLYVTKLSEMFITDFYSLNDKTSKTDIGGVDIVHKDILKNFLLNAENTYYKYVESNIYNNRKQLLPEVDDIKIESIENGKYIYGDKTDENAYIVKVSWTYTDTKFDSYQKNATLKFIHDGKKLFLVELQ